MRAGLSPGLATSCWRKSAVAVVRRFCPVAVRLLTDSASSIPDEDARAYSIRLVSMVLVDGDRATPEMDLDFDEFYAHLAKIDYLPTTSQPSPELLRSEVMAILNAGDDVLAVFLPRSFSSTYDALSLVIDQIVAESPELRARIALIDSGSVCMQEGYAVLAGAKCAQAGGSMGECVAAVERVKARSRFIFAPRTLTYLERGGRIGRASALLGSLLKLVPILTIEDEVATPFAKVRTYPKALMAIHDKFVADINASGGLKNVCVHFINESTEAVAFCKNVIEPLVGFAVRLIPVTPVVGALVGPAVGLVYETVDPIAGLRGGESTQAP
ncbi:MAG: DegV family protein [Actinomycetia bacterium]|nr:DegV family protein [Actinomycetes bacterium]